MKLLPDARLGQASVGPTWLVAAALVADGADSELVDPTEVIITDGPYGGATPDPDATRTAGDEPVK